MVFKVETVLLKPAYGILRNGVFKGSSLLWSFTVDSWDLNVVTNSLFIHIFIDHILQHPVVFMSWA